VVLCLDHGIGPSAVVSGRLSWSGCNALRFMTNSSRLKCFWRGFVAEAIKHWFIRTADGHAVLLERLEPSANISQRTDTSRIRVLTEITRAGMLGHLAQGRPVRRHQR
jgi:hypothetical protein